MLIKNAVIRTIAVGLDMAIDGQAKRFEDGLALANKGKVTEVGDHHARVESEHTAGRVYLVDLESGACSCEDSHRESHRLIEAGMCNDDRRVCKHYVAAQLMKCQQQLDGTYRPARAVRIYNDPISGRTMSADQALAELYPPVRQPVAVAAGSEGSIFHLNLPDDD